MKNPTTINDVRLVVLPLCFVVVIALPFFPERIGAQQIESTTEDQVASTTDETIQAAAIQANIASSEALQTAMTAAARAAEKKLADEQILRQIEALRGIVPNSTINALEKKYQVGAYAPQPVSLVAPIASSTPKTAATTGDSSFVFLKNLKQGNSGIDVLMLQKILNRDADTQIAKTGIGSPGNEIDYFGTLTKAAVIKFQNKHAAEILTPNGLVVGTGFVGLSTRVVLNDLAVGKNVPASPLPKIQTIARPNIMYCAPAFLVQRGSNRLTASEFASIGCVTANTKARCEAVDAYTIDTASLNKDGIPDCVWVVK